MKVNILAKYYSRKKGYTIATYKCQCCKRYIQTNKSKLKNKKTQYCKSCYEKSDLKKIDATKSRLKLNYNGKNNPNYRGQTKRICPCGKVFYRRISPSQMDKRCHIYCSMDCKKKYSKSISKPVYYKNIKFRSTWEVAFAKYCDSRNIKWKYESKIFKTPFGYYTPDFYLPMIKKYVEVKGYFRDKNSFEKYQWFKKEYKIMLVDKEYFLKKGFIFKHGKLTIGIPTVLGG